MKDVSSKAGGKGIAESRKERLAQALRANLKRRKQASGGPKPPKTRKSGGSGNTQG